MPRAAPRRVAPRGTWPSRMMLLLLPYPLAARPLPKFPTALSSSLSVLYHNPGKYLLKVLGCSCISCIVFHSINQQGQVSTQMAFFLLLASCSAQCISASARRLPIRDQECRVHADTLFLTPASRRRTAARCIWAVKSRHGLEHPVRRPYVLRHLRAVCFALHMPTELLLRSLKTSHLSRQ